MIQRWFNLLWGPTLQNMCKNTIPKLFKLKWKNATQWLETLYVTKLKIPPENYPSLLVSYKKLGKIVLRQYLSITTIVYMIMTMWWETGEGLISSSALGEVLSFKPPCLCFRKPSILEFPIYFRLEILFLFYLCDHSIVSIKRQAY